MAGETTAGIAALVDSLVRPHGPMKLLVTDRDGAMTSELAAQRRDLSEMEASLGEAGSHTSSVG